MRVANWRPKQVADLIYERAEQNANRVMDDVVEAAKARCPVGTVTREGTWSGQRTIAFTPSRGRNKGQAVRFAAKGVWLGRSPGDLRDTIRRANKPGSGNVRVYAGTYKINYAHFVERGTVHMRARPFLRPAFQNVKRTMLRTIQHGS